MMKIFKVFLSLGLIFGLVACGNDTSDDDAGAVTPTDVPCEGQPGELSLESINEYLNDSGDMGAGSKANVVAVIPISHVDGPREESAFYAFVNFKYVDRDFIKYQVTYLSCTCRSADVNYWSTAYVELTLPESQKIEDAEIKFISFDQDAKEQYLAGFWGDSDPIPTAENVTFETFKEQYFPFFVDKNYAYMQGLSVMEDIAPEDYVVGEGREALTIDTFSGASVSANNVIRMLNAVLEYHGTDEYFIDSAE